MKQLFSLLAGIAAILLVASGCTTHHRDAGADYLDRPENTGTVPYYTEYDVASSQTVGKGKAAALFWFFQFSDGKYCQLDRNPRLSILSEIFEIFSPTQKVIGNAKNSALYNACEVSKADQLLGATFEYKITDYLVFATVECTTIGFPAKVKGVKLLEKQPIILNNWQKVEYLAPYETPQVYSGPRNATQPLTLTKEQ